MLAAKYRGGLIGEPWAVWPVKARLAGDLPAVGEAGLHRRQGCQLRDVEPQPANGETELRSVDHQPTSPRCQRIPPARLWRLCHPDNVELRTAPPPYLPSR